MRPIKFRLRLDNKIVGYEKWYNGHRNSEDEHWEAKPQWLYSVDGDKWNSEPIFHNYKDQFTGNLDKNGKEIYEGDEVRGYYQRGATEDGYVQYDIDRFLVVGPGIRISEFATNIEVIGNIYQGEKK